GTMLEQLRASPSVESVGMAQLAPLGRGSWNDLVFVDGHEPTDVQSQLSLMNQVSDRYFTTLGTTVLAGREFDERDSRGSPGVVIVNVEFARHYFGSINVVGRQIRIGAEDSAPLEIIGVVETAKYSEVREEPERVAYTAWSQATDRAFRMHLVIRARAAAS